MTTAHVGNQPIFGEAINFKEGLVFATIHKAEARRLRSELHSLTQASYTVSTFPHIKRAFVASHQKPEKEQEAERPPPPPRTTITLPSTPAPPPQPTSPPNLQVCGLAERACLWESRFPWREKCPSRSQMRSAPRHRPPSISQCCVRCPEKQDACSGAVTGIFIYTIYLTSNLESG